MGVIGGSRLVRAGARRSASAALGAYGRLVLTVAERVGPDDAAGPGVASLPGGSHPRASGNGIALDARTADIGDLRRLALEATLAAAKDPGRPAYDRLTAATVNLSEWAAGRLLGEAERMRQAAVAVVSAGSGDGKLLARRQFDLALRRQFPWLDDVSATRLFDHGVLMTHRISGQLTASSAAGAAVPAGRLTSLVSRLRSKV